MLKQIFTNKKKFTLTPKSFGAASQRERGFTHTPTSVGVNSRSEWGFTLIETIVATGIVGIGIVATLSLFSSTVSFTQDREDFSVVVNLAREGIEIVRSIRDSSGYSALQDGTWIVDTTSNYYGFLVAADNADINICSNCGLNLTSGLYTHDPGVALSLIHI